MAPRQKITARRTAPKYIRQGINVFYDDAAQRKFLQLSGLKAMGTRLVDTFSFPSLPIIPLFQYQKLVPFITPREPIFYKDAVCEFYANLRFQEGGDIFSYRTMVQGVEITFNQDTIADMLGWTIGELSPNYLAGTLDWMEPNKLARIAEIRELEKFTYEELSADLMKPGGKHRNNKLDAKELHPLARTLSVIITYNIFPHWNCTEMTVDILIMIYCIIHKIKIQWHKFICYLMMNFKSILPFCTLVTQIIQEYFPEPLHTLGYKKDRKANVINSTTISKMGLVIRPTSGASSSHQPATDPMDEDEPDAPPAPPAPSSEAGLSRLTAHPQYVTRDDFSVLVQQNAELTSQVEYLTSRMDSMTNMLADFTTEMRGFRTMMPDYATCMDEMTSAFQAQTTQTTALRSDIQDYFHRADQRYQEDAQVAAQMRAYQFHHDYATQCDLTDIRSIGFPPRTDVHYPAPSDYPVYSDWFRSTGYTYPYQPSMPPPSVTPSARPSTSHSSQQSQQGRQ